MILRFWPVALIFFVNYVQKSNFQWRENVQFVIVYWHQGLIYNFKFKIWIWNNLKKQTKDRKDEEKTKKFREIEFFKTIIIFNLIIDLQLLDWIWLQMIQKWYVHLFFFFFDTLFCILSCFLMKKRMNHYSIHFHTIFLDSIMWIISKTK